MRWPSLLGRPLLGLLPECRRRSTTRPHFRCGARNSLGCFRHFNSSASSFLARFSATCLSRAATSTPSVRVLAFRKRCRRSSSRCRLASRRLSSRDASDVLVLLSNIFNWAWIQDIYLYVLAQVWLMDVNRSSSVCVCVCTSATSAPTPLWKTTCMMMKPPHKVCSV